jgi:hypothetical protein
MIRRIATAAAAGALALTGLAAFGAGAATAVTQITAGAGSSIHCNAVKAKAFISPALKDNWVQADHASDPNVAVRAIPDTTFASNGPTTVTGKVKISGCSGVVKQGSVTATVKKITAVLSTDPAHPGLANPATCTALVNMAPPAPTDAQYKFTLVYKSGTKGVTIADSNLSGVSLAAAGVGFQASGGTISGSFAGGSSTTQANIDGKTLTAFLSSSGLGHVVSSTNPKDGAKPCQAALKLKAAKGGKHPKPAQASLKPPKGLFKIGIASGSFDASR